MPKSLFLLFIFGRPGSGKSTVYDLLRQRLPKDHLGKRVIKIDDYFKLLALTERDNNHIRHRHPPGGGFDIINDTALNEVLSEMNDDVRRYEKDDVLVFVEFARTNYLEALKNFNPEFLERGVIIYINCSFDICCKRNFSRASKVNSDGHLVPRDNMERLFQTDDINELVRVTSMPIIVLNNNTNGFGVLEKAVDELVITLTYLIALD